MHTRFAISLLLLLVPASDLPKVNSLRPPATPLPTNFPPGESIPMLPVITIDPQDAANPQDPAKKSPTLQESSKLTLIRFVSGEFAKARKPLPAGKDGFIIFVGKPLDEQFLDRAVANRGAAVNSGDNVQITALTFAGNIITVDINGGGRPKRHWRDHIQIGVGGVSTPQTQTTTTTDKGPPGFQQGAGGTIFITFPKIIPDLTPTELKEILDPLLDFSNKRSASVQWVDTIPPEIRKAIADRHPTVGMDREQVIAALGKPDRKVRERDANGNDTEDWIYGRPPDKTIFVRFTGDHVTGIKQYPQ
jgi:hypothetical protein